MGNPHEVDRSERQEKKMDKREKQAEEAAAAQPAPAAKGAAPAPQAAAPVGGPSPADFIASATELQGKLASFKSQPALSGPQIAHSLSAAESQLLMVLAEARSAQPQAERISAFLASAKKSLAEAAGSAPALGGLAASFDELDQKAKKTFGGSASASANKAVAA